jgi:soluble lytic murein transglycosylase-like protein
VNLEQVAALSKKIAPQFNLDPVLLTAMAEQESAYNPWAIRPESHSGFRERYGAAYHDIIIRLRETVAQHWIQFDDIFYCSYGLLQTMYPVVLETAPDLGVAMKFPTELCDPEKGLTAGCRIFAKKLAGAGNNVQLALQHWNGGGNPNYYAEVLARIPHVQLAF